MARQTDNAYVVRHILASELRAETYLVCLLQQLFLQFDVAEGTSCLVARGRQRVVVMGGSQFDGQQVFLRRGAADHDGDMIRRAGSRAKRFHFLHEERNERAGILDARFGLLVEIGLVRRTATFGDAEETILVAFGGFEINLRRQVALGVHLVVHVQRGVLAVAQVALGVGIEDAAAQCLFVAGTRPNLLSFLAMNDGGSGVLAERQLSFACHFGVAQEGECYVLVVRGSLRVAQYLSHLFVVRAAQHETHVVEGLLRHERQRLGLYFQYLVSFKLADRHMVFCQQIILGFVFPQLEHGGILKICHSIVCYLNFIFRFASCAVCRGTRDHTRC